MKSGPPAAAGAAQGPAPVASLSNSVINLQAVREQATEELIGVLESVRGGKGLVLDPLISGPLGLISGVSLLKDHGVEKIYHLEGSLDTDCRNLIYLVRPTMDNMKIVADHIHSHTEQGRRKEYAIYFVPRRTMVCERILQERGVYADVTIGEFHLDLIPFDDDILSLELGSCYTECFLEQDRSSLFYVARAIMKLQVMFGIIPNIRGKGTCAELVTGMMLRMRKEMAGEENNASPEIDTLILIDRQCDMVTPMCTQLTYEGLIDEMIGINNTYVDLEAEIAAPDPSKVPPGRTLKTPLNSTDRLYSELRDLNFAVLGPALHRRAKEIDDYYNRRHDARTVSEMREFIKGLGNYQADHQSLRLHTNIAEKIVGFTRESNFRAHLSAEQSLLMGEDEVDEYVETLISKKAPLESVLRLLVLRSVISNGLRAKRFDFFRSEIVQTYGFDSMMYLDALEKLDLLKTNTGKSNFPTLRRSLRLIVEDIQESNPQDIAYVYSGYAPLSVRLIQEMVKAGKEEAMWKNNDDINRLVPGPAVDVRQRIRRRGSVEPRGRNQVVLVFFLGGCTYTEVAAIRWLSQRDDHRDYIIATTKIINGKTILEAIRPASLLATFK